MDRRTVLATVATIVVTSVGGCSTGLPDRARRDTPTPTTDDTRTVRIGPNSPSCPSDSWGQMAVFTDEVSESVTSEPEGEQLVIDHVDGISADDLRLTEPRPDEIKWKDRRLDIAEQYDSDTWYLFSTGREKSLIAVLVVSTAEPPSKIVQFYIGDC